MDFWMPSVEVETASGVRELNLKTRELTNRNIYLMGEINDESANATVMQLLHLQDESDDEIRMYINSGGGEVISGMLIYDVMQSITVPLSVYCTGIAASMAAVLLAGGQKGRRYILPHSKTMIHEPLIAGGIGGSASSIQNTAESIMETKAMINGILAEHTGKDIAEINEATKFDNYMNAEKSVEFGLCDKIVTSLR